MVAGIELQGPVVVRDRLVVLQLVLADQAPGVPAFGQVRVQFQDPAQIALGRPVAAQPRIGQSAVEQRFQQIGAEFQGRVVQRQRLVESPALVQVVAQVMQVVLEAGVFVPGGPRAVVAVGWRPVGLQQQVQGVELAQHVADRPLGAAARRPVVGLQRAAGPGQAAQQVGRQRPRGAVGRGRLPGRRRQRAADVRVAAGQAPAGGRDGRGAGPGRPETRRAVRPAGPQPPSAVTRTAATGPGPRAGCARRTGRLPRRRPRQSARPSAAGGGFAGGSGWSLGFCWWSFRSSARSFRVAATPCGSPKCPGGPAGARAGAAASGSSLFSPVSLPAPYNKGTAGRRSGKIPGGKGSFFLGAAAGLHARASGSRNLRGGTPAVEHAPDGPFARPTGKSIPAARPGFARTAIPTAEFSASAKDRRPEKKFAPRRFYFPIGPRAPP